ncbi:hypothetical protein NEOKW01_0360 [Nematocida sp. AWRm80]|nr:hypothetical protein NEOKW01_0360 [Nematocida sp. AWRm80]
MVLEEKRIRRIEPVETVIFLIGEVVFDIDHGPVVKTPAGLSPLEEQEISFGALPDTRSYTLHREGFVFVGSQGVFHILFIQEPDKQVKRGYIQKSIFIKANKVIPWLPRYLEESVSLSSEYTPEIVFYHLIDMNDELKSLGVPYLGHSSSTSTPSSSDDSSAGTREESTQAPGTNRNTNRNTTHSNIPSSNSTIPSDSNGSTTGSNGISISDTHKHTTISGDSSIPIGDRPEQPIRLLTNAYTSNDINRRNESISGYLIYPRHKISTIYTPETHPMISKNKKSILENLFRCKSFLVIGSTPMQVSETICTLHTYHNMFYGGEIHPYRSSFLPVIITKHILIGTTNEHIYQKNNYDNVIDLISNKYTTKYTSTTDSLEKYIRILNEYFDENPMTFSPNSFIEHLILLGVPLKTRNIFWEFFESPNYASWIASLGYSTENN